MLKDFIFRWEVNVLTTLNFMWQGEGNLPMKKKHLVVKINTNRLKYVSYMDIFASFRANNPVLPHDIKIELHYLVI